MANWTPAAFGIFMVTVFGVMIVAAMVIDYIAEYIERKRAIARRLKSIRWQ